MRLKVKKYNSSIVMSFRLNLRSDCDFLIFKVLNSITKSRRTTVLKQILHNYFLRFIEKKKEQYPMLSDVLKMNYEEYFNFLKEHQVNNFVSRGQVLRINAQLKGKEAESKKRKKEEIPPKERELIDDSKILSIDDFIF